MCFFSRRNAQRSAPLSSSRCQNGPLWTSKLSRVHVHQPANSPDVAWTAPSWRGGAFLGTKFTGLSNWVGVEWFSIPSNDPHASPGKSYFTFDQRRSACLNALLRVAPAAGAFSGRSRHGIGRQD